MDFDQIDLVKVLSAAKYRSGQPATWGEGNWGGAPGGHPGSPPPGNGFFDQLDIIAALSSDIYVNGPYAAGKSSDEPSHESILVGYDSETGEVSIETMSGHDLTSIGIESSAGIFTNVDAENLHGTFDVDTDTSIFKATVGGSFGTLSFGAVAQPGLDQAFLAGDLSAIGSMAAGGQLSNVEFVFVPEPSTIGMLLFVISLGVYLRHSARQVGCQTLRE